MKLKNPGKTLYFSQFGGERPIPEKFIAAMERAEERTKVPIDAELPQLGDEIVEARFDPRYENTNEKWLIVIKKKEGVIGPLRDFRTNDQGQSIQVSATMFRVADTTFTQEVPSITQDVAINDLGNGWAIQEVAVMGTWVNGTFTPGIYQGIELSKRRTDPVPEPFRLGLPLTETQSIVPGTVAAPSLGVNDISASERQITEHKKLLTRLTRDGVTLPFSLVSKRTNDKKQVVIVTDTYRFTGTAPAISITQDIKVIDLGDGHEVVTTELIPALFGNETYTKEILDLFPQKFRGTLPTTRTREVVAGTATMPTLSAGDLMRTEEQITAITKLTEVLTRAGITLPAIITDRATITDYGGGLVDINQYINVIGSYSLDEGLNYVNSKVTNLGNGYELKETIGLASGTWPQLDGTEVDETFGLAIPFTQQVVAAGTAGGTNTSVKPLDKTKSLKIVKPVPTAGYLAYVLPLFNDINIDFPAELIGITAYLESGVGAGNYSTNVASYTLQNNGSGSISVRGEAQGSAAVIPELAPDIKQPWGVNVPCDDYLFFVVIGTSREQILTKASSAAGATVNPWPKFVPKPITLICRGQKVNVKQTADAHATQSISTDYNGVKTLQGDIRASGSGVSFDVGLTIKVVRIPATVHAAITVGGSPSGTAAFATSTSVSTNVISSNPIGVTGFATATVTPTIISATPGQQTIPPSGLYGRIRTEPFKEGLVKVHVEVVNFANVT